MNRRKFLKMAAGSAAIFVLPLPDIALDNAPLAGYDANFISFDYDGFTVNWPEAASVARIVTFIASSSTEVYRGKFPKSHMSGNQSIIGVGFKPDKVLVEAFAPVRGEVVNE